MTSLLMTTIDEDNGTAGQGTKIHILVDGEYRLTVTRDFWVSQNIRSGDEIDDAEFAAFCEAAGSCRAFNAAVDILSRRDHSSKELQRKVARRSGAEFAREAVERLEEMGYVNDERYAHTLAQELYERRGMGKSASNRNSDSAEYRARRRANAPKSSTATTLSG